MIASSSWWTCPVCDAAGFESRAQLTRMLRSLDPELVLERDVETYTVACARPEEHPAAVELVGRRVCGPACSSELTTLIDSLAPDLYPEMRRFNLQRPLHDDLPAALTRFGRPDLLTDQRGGGRYLELPGGRARPAIRGARIVRGGQRFKSVAAWRLGQSEYRASRWDKGLHSQIVIEDGLSVVEALQLLAEKHFHRLQLTSQHPLEDHAKWLYTEFLSRSVDSWTTRLPEPITGLPLRDTLVARITEPEVLEAFGAVALLQHASARATALVPEARTIGTLQQALVQLRFLPLVATTDGNVTQRTESAKRAIATRFEKVRFAQIDWRVLLAAVRFPRT